jgi:hypothetical protein
MVATLLSVIIYFSETSLPGLLSVPYHNWNSYLMNS